MNLKPFLAALAIVVAPVSAHALNLIGTQTDAIGFDLTELDGTLNIAGFASATPITQIDIHINGFLESTISLLNNGSKTESVTATTTSQFSFSASELSLPAAPQLSLSGSTGSVDLASGASTAIAVSDSGSFAQSVNSGLAALLDGFSVDVSTLSGLTVLGGGGNIDASQTTLARAEIEVKYFGEEVSTVPVPAGILLMGTALAGFGVMRRKAKKDAA